MLSVLNKEKAATPWQSVTVADIAEKVAMGPFGSSIKVETFVENGIPIISGQHLRGTRLDDSPEHNFIAYDHAQRLANANVQRGDVVFTHAGNIGQVAYIPQDSRYERYVISQRQFCMRCDLAKAVPEFIAYYFKSFEGQQKLLANASQVGVPSIARPVSYLRSLKIPLPPINVQRRIARILGTIDYKIDLNRRVNETLEAMTQAIFKDWFVDFGPVRAQMTQTLPYLTSEIWDLFPDSIADDCGPEGWTNTTVSEIAKTRTQSVNPSTVSTTTPYIGLEHMPRRSIAITEWSDAGKVTSNKSEFKTDDILFGKLRPYFHKVGIAPVDGICSTDIVVVRPQTTDWHAFLLACLSSKSFVDYAAQTSTGTKMPRTSWKLMSQFELWIPPTQIVRAYQDTVQPLIQRIGRNINLSRILRQVRDLLLPKLISGELRVKNVEKIVESVA